MFKAFSAGDSTALSPNLTIESSVDRVSAIGAVDITRDLRGLELARQLQRILQDVIQVLQQDQAAGQLPDELQLKKPTTHPNPLS
jgi:hypothetical protein